MPSANIAAPNSVLFIMDRTGGEVPESMEGNLCAFTSTCIAVGTLSEQDGMTRVTLEIEPQRPPRGAPDFDCVISTPSKYLQVCTAHDEVVVEIRVREAQVRVRLWANDQHEPSDVHVLVSSPLAE